MKILILGSGGREHALAEIYSKNPRVKKVFVAPGNGLMDYQNPIIATVPKVNAIDLNAVLHLIKKQKIDLVDIAQDDPLAAGFVDKLEKEGIAAFGPKKAAAEIEWSKNWARKFMTRYKLPIPRFQTFSDPKKAIAYIKRTSEQLLYIKASGLALGKGAIRAENKKEAIEAVNAMGKFGKAGETFLVEEGLMGEEFSLFAICYGKHFVVAGNACDHKTVYNADQGPNTGGMGCVSPTGAINNSIVQAIKLKILRPFIEGMQQEKRPYSGILYLGGMLTKDGIKIIEFNARWGDPEAQVILPGLKTPYLDLIEATLSKKLSKLSLRFDDKTRISVAGVALGYPQDYSRVKGKEVFGLLDTMKLPNIRIYGAGILRQGKRFFVNGGRVFHLVAEGKDIKDARRRAYEAMSMVYIEGNNLHYRTDIGWREIERY